ncbi:unnamed protein product [Penicillium bialowiezense]
MPISDTKPTPTSNGAAAMSQGNISQVPAHNRNSVDRFTRAPASEGPYFAGARMPERSAHLTGLSSQLSAMDEIMKTGS